MKAGDSPRRKRKGCGEGPEEFCIGEMYFNYMFL